MAPTHHTVEVDLRVVTTIMETLLTNTLGPAQAFGTLCVCLIKLNEFSAKTSGDTPLSHDALLAELATGLKSAEAINANTHH